MNYLYRCMICMIGIIAVMAVLYARTNYENFAPFRTVANYPCGQETVLVQDSYPTIGLNQISDNGADDIWWHYPIFLVGSYKQITNNIKYPNNPDEGTCMPASMCGALYHDKKHWQEKQPAPSVQKNRVGYYNTNVTLIDNRPFRTSIENILY